MGSALRVIVADGDPASRTRLEDWLTELGHAVTRVGDGAPLVEACRLGSFDLVISDVRMPKLDGLTAAARIREGGTVPIILAADAWTADGAERAAAVGAHVLQKPFHPLDLVAVIAAAQRSARSRADVDPVRQLVDTDVLHAVFTLDADGRVADWNGGAARLLGYSAEEVRGHAWTVFTPDEGPVADALRHEARDGWTAADGWLMRKDGAQVWASGSVTRLPGGGHGVLLRDRTAARAREVETAARLTALEEADARRTEFLATLAHELRNQIFSVMNLSHLVGHRSPEVNVGEVGQKLERQVRRLAREVEELMDVARVRLGKVSLQLRPVDLGEVVRQSVDVVSSRIEEAGHALTVTVPPAPPKVMGDSDRLVQVVVNLLANAVKYTPPGGRIGVAVEPDGTHAVLRVTDTGIGVPAERLASVFELFSQDDRSLAQAQGGLGIGLALVKELVALHGGTVRASSAGVDRGSEFVVRLPLAPGVVNRD